MEDREPPMQKPHGWKQYAVGVLVILAFAALAVWLHSRGVL